MTITFPFIYFAPSIPPFLSQGGVRSGDALIFIIIIVIVMIYIYIYIYYCQGSYFISTIYQLDPSGRSSLFNLLLIRFLRQTSLIFTLSHALMIFLAQTKWNNSTG